MAEISDIRGEVQQDGSAILLARVVDRHHAPLQQADLSAAQYTLYLLDARDAGSRTTVEGHVAVDVPVAALVYDALQVDDLWTVDAEGYNLRHELDLSAGPAFAVAGRDYLCVFTLAPVSGQPILVRFRLHAT